MVNDIHHEARYLTFLCFHKLSIACTYYIELLLKNPMYSSLSVDCKRGFYAFCRQHGYLSRILSVILLHCLIVDNQWRYLWKWTENKIAIKTGWISRISQDNKSFSLRWYVVFARKHKTTVSLLFPLFYIVIISKPCFSHPTNDFFSSKRPRRFSSTLCHWRFQPNP